MPTLKQRLSVRQWYHRNRLRVLPEIRLRHFKARSGVEVSAAWYQAQLEAQSGLCAICGRPERARSKAGNLKALAIDHHGQQLRELLCESCNRGIGFFEEDPDRLRAALAYLERHAIDAVAAVRVVAGPSIEQGDLFACDGERTV